MNTFIYWNPDPEIINVFGFSLRYYGVLFVIGIIIGVAVLKRVFIREGIATAKLDKLAIYGVAGIFLGARLAHCLFYEPDYYFSHPLEILIPVELTQEGYVFTGYQGLASHGGALGMLIAIWLYARHTSEPVLKTMDMIAIVGPLSGMFIRLANLANSEIIGKPTDVPWAFVFARVDNTPRHPAQLYEAIVYSIIFAILWYLYRSGRKPGTGFFFGLSVVLVFASRFAIEFLKKRQVAFEEEMFFDMGQWLSVPFILIGLLFLLRGLGRKMSLTESIGSTEENTERNTDRSEE